MLSINWYLANIATRYSGKFWYPKYVVYFVHMPADTHIKDLFINIRYKVYPDKNLT